VRPAVALVSVALLALAPSAAAQPHSLVRTQERAGVLVYDLHAGVTRASRARLRVRVRVGAASSGRRSRRIVVRVGRAERSFVVPRGRVAFRKFVFTARRPPARSDAVEVTVRRPGSTTAYAQIVLGSAAWRDTPGFSYGVGLARRADIRVSRLLVDAAPLSPSTAQATFEWSATAPDGGTVLTDELACRTTCPPRRELESHLQPGVENVFHDPMTLERRDPAGVGVDLRRDNLPLGRAALPWPG